MIMPLAPAAQRAIPRALAVTGLAMAGIVAGCSTSNTPGERSPDLISFLGLDAQPGTAAGDGSVPPKARARGPGDLQPKYCYKTLATVDCYPSPQAGRKRQRVGSFHDAID